MEKNRISEYSEQIRGISYKPEDIHDDLNDNSITLLRANNIADGNINFDNVVYVDKSKVSKKQILKKGDVLICASSGSKHLVGKAAQICFEGEYTFGAFCKAVRPININNIYMGMYFQSSEYRRIISSVSQGANINNIKNQDIDNLLVKIPNEAEQKNVSEVLIKVSQIIMYKKQQLDELNNLIKSRFVEMFGDPVSNPMGWKKQQLKDICKINPKKSDDNKLVDGLEVSFVAMPSVTEKGELDASIIKQYDEVRTGFTYFAENDVLFAKITPCMENGKGAVAVGLKNRVGFGSTEFHVLRPIEDKTDPYWIYYLTMFDFFRKEAERKMTGSAGQRRVPATFLENYEVGVPPITYQNQFTNFVQEVDKLKFAN